MTPLKCSKQEVTRIVQQATEGEWVNVTPSKKDKRVKLVCLSKKGRVQLQQGFDLYANLEEKLFETLTKEEQLTLKDAAFTLNKLLKAQL